MPTVLGRDARLQFVHLDDALEVLYRSVVEDHPGTFNVAGPCTLALSQAIRREGWKYVLTRFLRSRALPT